MRKIPDLADVPRLGRRRVVHSVGVPVVGPRGMYLSRLIIVVPNQPLSRLRRHKRRQFSVN